MNPHRLCVLALACSFLLCLAPTSAEPEPAQVPAPEPAPATAPEPAPATAPEPAPAPAPEPSPVTAPEPAPAPSPVPAHGPVPAPETIAEETEENEEDSDAQNAGDQQEDSEDGDDGTDLKGAHAVFMCLSFGFVLPLGIMSMRYFQERGDKYVKIHRALGALGYLLVLVGFILGAVQGSKTDTGEGIKLAHLIFGVIIFFLINLQAFSLLRFFEDWVPIKDDESEDRTDSRAECRSIHTTTAPLLAILSIIQMALGFGLLLPGTEATAVFWILFGIVAVFFCYYEYRKGRIGPV